MIDSFFHDIIKKWGRDIMVDKTGGLKKSKFRSRFHLKEKEKQYILNKGMDTIEKHADDFILKRLSSAVIPNDGKQTPMHGHPVFIAQHATATCCRGCLSKWYQIPKNQQLTARQRKEIVEIIMNWIKEEMK